ncbi:MAG: flagellar basal-body MS-ring/collar protein FliF, partial [Eubacteriales bacterium]|nr:flagellar basal-body MS-ring/collar protein FliF [Eubacteriales bacterium]
MEKGKRIRFIVLISIIIVIIVVTSVLLNRTSYAVLYSGMEAADAGEVMSVLSDMGIEAKAEGDDTILVADDEVDTVRLELAAEGYPSSGFNYDIYESASGLGVTDKEKQVYYQFQLQENLRQTIVQLDKVEAAVVNLDLGQGSSFVLSDDEEDATASVVLTLAEGEELSSSEVSAITQLVSKSISGLKAENVSIIDSNMNLYSTEDGGTVKSADSQLELQMSVQQSLQQQIINLLSPVFGEDNVRAEVSGMLNFDTKVTEYTEYSSPND